MGSYQAAAVMREETAISDWETGRPRVKTRERERPDGLVRQYWHEVTAYPLLGAERELALARQMEDIRTELRYAPFRLVPRISYDLLYRTYQELKAGRGEVYEVMDLDQPSAQPTAPPFAEQENRKREEAERQRALSSLARAVQKLKLAEKKLPSGNYSEEGAQIVRGLRLQPDYLEYLLASIKKQDLPLSVQKYFKQGEEQYARLYNLFFCSNLRLVFFTAKNFRYPGVPFLDLIQYGNLGLLQAVKRYDFRRGARFSTYAVWWIRQSIRHGVFDHEKTIRLPIHQVELLSKLGTEGKVLSGKLGREPTLEEISRATNISLDKITALQCSAKTLLSLDETMGENDFTLRSVVPDTTVPPLPRAMEQQQLTGHLERILYTLPRQEEEVIRRRFGLGGKDAETLREIANTFNLSRERVRQLQKQALGRLQRRALRQGLKVYLEQED